MIKVKILVKNSIKNLFNSIFSGISKLSIGQYIFRQIIDVFINHKEVIKHKNHRLVFSTPNWLCKYRIDTFSTKEPETLLWLESIPEDNPKTILLFSKEYLIKKASTFII